VNSVRVAANIERKKERIYLCNLSDGDKSKICLLPPLTATLISARSFSIMLAQVMSSCAMKLRRYLQRTNKPEASSVNLRWLLAPQQT